MNMRDIIDLVLIERAHRINVATGQPLLVFENPTPQQLQSLIADGPVSGLLAPHDRLFIWQSASASHADIIATFSLNKIGCIDLTMLDDGPAIHGKSVHYRRQAAAFVEHLALMRHLYGAHFAVHDA
jgi:hypothetical protein